MGIVGSCNSCLMEVNTSTKYINCPDCNRLYHQSCWKNNANRCIEFGCKGAKDLDNPEEIKPSSPDSTNNFNDQSSGQDNNNQNVQMGFRKVNQPKSLQNKIIAVLIIIVMGLLAFIVYNSFFKVNNQRVQTRVVENTQAPSINPVIEVTPQIEDSPVVIATPEATPIPSIDIVVDSPNLTESTPTPLEQESVAPVNNQPFNMDMSLSDYYTIQVSSEDTLARAEKTIQIIPNSFIKAKPKSKNDKSKYYYVVVAGKFSTLKDASAYRNYVIENYSNKNNAPNISDAFVTESSRLEDLAVINSISGSVPTTVAVAESPVVSNNTSVPAAISSNEYYTVQVASKEAYSEAKILSDRIAQSFIMKKYSKAQKKYYYLVVVGKLENKEKAEDYKKYIIENYSNAGNADDVPKSWVISNKGLLEIIPE